MKQIITIYMAMLSCKQYLAFVLVGMFFLAACGHENTARQHQFDLLENCTKSKPIHYKTGHLQTTDIQISYPKFGASPFKHLIGHLIMLDTTGVYCVGQKSLRINYFVRWATKNVLSMRQEILLDCPMSQGKRKTIVEHLYTFQNDTIYKLNIEGSPTLLQEIQLALKKRTAPYCSPPKIEEVFPVIHKGHLEVTPHYGSSLCDTTFKRFPIRRKDMRLTDIRVFLALKS